MMVFFYGTLLDPERAATGYGHGGARSADGAGIRKRFRAVLGVGRAFPFLVRATGCSAQGMLAGGLRPRQLRKLARYEGAEYRLGFVTVTTEQGKSQRAMAFLPARGIRRSYVAFNLRKWQQTHRPACLRKLSMYGKHAMRRR